MSAQSSSEATLQRDIRRACLLEVTARKPGNVRPGASFADLCYEDFVRSAVAIAPVLARTRELGVGRAVLESVERTHAAVGKNTNLGIILLLAPLAAAEPGEAARLPPSSRVTGVRNVLDRLTREDAALVYRAIRRAQPGGMGKVEAEDVSQEPTGTLVEVMRLAAGRDAIAAEYANGFDLVLNFGVPALTELWSAEFAVWRAECPGWERAVIGLHLRLMARQPDTLIARKCGVQEARQSARFAQDVLDAGWPVTEAGRRKVGELDRWLREKGNRRNPGTTADLVTACLFVGLRDKRVAINDEFLMTNVERMTKSK